MAAAEVIFRDKSAIVTGGASGIGRALAERLGALGAAVTVADMQGPLAEEVAAGIRAKGGKAEAAVLDITDVAATEALYGSVAARAGRLDYAFNNAGIWMMGDADKFPLADWHRLIDVNLKGTINGTRAAYAIMLRQASGHIVNTASVAGLTPDPGCTAYATTKHAIVGLSKSLRVEAERRGVKVTVLCPGVVATPLLEGGGKFGKVLDKVDPEQMRQMWKRMRPMPVDAFAERALRDVARNKAVIVWPVRGKLFWLVDRISPARSIRLALDMYVANQRLMGLE
jgi:NAD(P)-dependent dehydrogenase (short-subunit alcohol dehydrogenase family)